MDQRPLSLLAHAKWLAMRERVRVRRRTATRPLLVPERLGLSSGHFHAKRLIEAVGVVRAAMAHDTTMEELDRLIGVLDRVL